MNFMKRMVVVSVSASLMALPVSVCGASPVPLRGVVEGFYGSPWTWEARQDMLAFCASHGMNAYIYAPKDDTYHRSQWRVPYPADKLSEIERLAACAKRNHIRFVFAVSPGLDFRYAGRDGKRDRECLLEKLEAVYAIGVRDFAIFFDDIEEKNGRGQARLLNWLEKRLGKRHPDVSPLLAVPTEYTRQAMRFGDGKITPYTRSFSAALREDIRVLFTGEGVCIGRLEDGQLADANGIYGRKLGLWWNYPVNDYMEAKLALGPVDHLPTREEIPAIFFNPMQYPEMSKIALATAAQYANAPRQYDPQRAWEQAVEEEYGSLAPDMKIFAAHSQHLENSWANMGKADGEEFRAHVDAFWKSWPDGPKARENWQILRNDAARMSRAADKLLEGLPDKKLDECRPQLMQMKRMAQAAGIALDLLKAGKGEMDSLSLAELKKQREEIRSQEKRAVWSEQAVLRFIDEILQTI